MIEIDGETVFDHQATLLRLITEATQNEDHQFRGAEIGVASGRTSEYLLRKLPHIHWWMIDSWACPTGHRRGQGYYDAAMETARERTVFATGRRTLVRKPSIFGASLYEDGYFDLVFIDANHLYESVLTDCVAWWPKISGGIMAGHDIDSPKDKSGVWGVRRAVEWFSRAVGVPFTVEKNVWIMRK